MDAIIGQYRFAKSLERTYIHCGLTGVWRDGVPIVIHLIAVVTALLTVSNEGWPVVVGGSRDALGQVDSRGVFCDHDLIFSDGES